MLQLSPIESPTVAPAQGKIMPMRAQESVDIPEADTRVLAEDVIYTRTGPIRYTRLIDPPYFPEYYNTSWLKDAFDYEFLVNITRESGTSIDTVKRYEEFDFEEYRKDQVFAAAMVATVIETTNWVSTSRYIAFLRKFIDAVPILHQRSPSKLENLIRSAQKLYFGDPETFLRAYAGIVRELYPTSEFAQTQQISYGYSTVWLAKMCYSLRVVRHRMPFSCIHLDDSMIECMERSLIAHDIEEHLRILCRCTSAPHDDMLDLVFWRAERRHCIEQDM